MYSHEFDYVRAQSVGEAIQQLADHESAKLLAGGHSLIPILKLRQASPSLLVDIGRIEAMKGISRQNGRLRIGALTTHAMVVDSGDIPAALRDAASVIADLQVRNRATVGGNIAHADPASDLPTVFTALGATFYVTGPGGERTIRAEDFFTGLFETAMAGDEVLTAIEVPAPGGSTGSAYAKLINPASGYAMLGAGAEIVMEGGVCSRASVAVGGLTPKATKAPSVELALVGRALDENTLSSAVKEVENDLGRDLLGDIHASADYRRAMAPVYIRRALSAALQRAAP